jgi:hypothetical protein
MGHKQVQILLYANNVVLTDLAIVSPKTHSPF